MNGSEFSQAVAGASVRPIKPLEAEAAASACSVRDLVKANLAEKLADHFSGVIERDADRIAAFVVDELYGMELL